MTTRFRRRPPRGLTLVEMLVATALTLMLVAALAQAFAIVGTTIAQNRATLTMAGQMRIVTQRLQADLSGITIPVRPWPSASSGLGYFEYVEGAAHDGSLLETEVPQLDGTDTGSGIYITHFGDVDDVLMFTSRTPAEAPFFGMFFNQDDDVQEPHTSQLAEVVWWATLTEDVGGDLDERLNNDGSNYADNMPDPEPLLQEDATVYRRALLIAPELNGRDGRTSPTLSSGETITYAAKLPAPLPATAPPTATQPYDVSNQADLARLREDLKAFFAENDLSVRIVREPPGPNPSGPVTLYMVANSLQDLTQRENRFAHNPVVRSDPNSGNLTYVAPVVTASNTTSVPHNEHPFPYGLDRDEGRDSVTRLPIRRTATNSNVNDLYAEPGMIKEDDFRGEDVMLTHCIGFDVRLFDPDASIAIHPGDDGAWGAINTDDDGNGTDDDFSEAGWPGTDDQAVSPGDRGFGRASGAVTISNAGSDWYISRIGRGAYVDLNYTDKIHLHLGGSGTGNKYDQITTDSVFSDDPTPADKDTSPALADQLHIRVINYQSQAADSDSWTYDTWSYAYESDGIDQNGDGTTDEGTNGFDDDGTNGADDYGERETAPPYAVPLRGIQVKVRMIDHSSRQVQQMTVTADFTP